MVSCNAILFFSKGSDEKNFINRLNYPIKQLDDPKNFFSKILNLKIFEIFSPLEFSKINVIHQPIIAHYPKRCKTCIGSPRSFQDTFKPNPSGRFPAIYSENRIWVARYFHCVNCRKTASQP